MTNRKYHCLRRTESLSLKLRNQATAHLFSTEGGCAECHLELANSCHNDGRAALLKANCMTEQRPYYSNHSPYSIHRLSPAVKDFLAGNQDRPNTSADYSCKLLYALLHRCCWRGRWNNSRSASGRCSRQATTEGSKCKGSCKHVAAYRQAGRHALTLQGCSISYHYDCHAGKACVWFVPRLFTADLAERLHNTCPVLLPSLQAMLSSAAERSSLLLIWRGLPVAGQQGCFKDQHQGASQTVAGICSR